MPSDVCWIETIPAHRAEGLLMEAYEQVGRPDGTVHNLYRAFSLWPTPLPWADGLYRAILHSDDHALPRWFQELLSTQVAILTDCAYAAAHHGANFKALHGDGDKAERMLAAVRAGVHGGALEEIFEEKQAALLRYGAKLTLEPQSMREADIAALRAAGVTDREILEANQISANFNYWVRVINGLGIRLGGERVGAYGGGGDRGTRDGAL